MKNFMVRAWGSNKSILLFLALMLIFRSAVADWSDVPTGSMRPTIVEGDRILVNKMAYDVRVPFTHFSLYQLSNPDRGDIVVFDSKVSGKRLVKRVVGVPGDNVRMKNNILTINGRRLDYELVKADGDSLDKIENLLGVEHFVRVDKHSSPMSSFSAGTIPSGHYLALGDNRDNSADSRVIGLIPRKEIVGRASRVVFSLDYENRFLPREARFLKSL
ncbi:signal peptidase I [Microbulbifer sp. NBRC 101763]|uniref:signal peptidase I n=1 Tax=unclassified Microbulbifer TaxID=2619833 RepID=UPI0024AE8029|nr:signal peptidase I [Microbulbifer sp. MLAF003]WHI53222.1 signal peptidase I [Microbulbifer sp. MLAF003]